MAIREDEIAARATGINTFQSKLLALAIGAAFAGLGGVLFASRNQFTGPEDHTMMVSINVLALVIVGGMGSIPGVILGAFALKGLPEMLRELDIYRLMFFGALLVVMMILRPEGLWPATRPRLEKVSNASPRRKKVRSRRRSRPKLREYNMQATLETRQVTKMFGGLTPSTRLTWSFPEQTIASIIGPNGAGKTTLFNCISGFYTPEKGQVLFYGQPIQGHPDQRSRPPGHCPHVPEYSPVQQHDRPGKYPGRPVPALEKWLDRRRSAPPALQP